MALDISGIGNIGEFFSQHYLDALLEKDLKDTLARWAKRKADEKLATPQERLARLADPYFRTAAQAENLSSPSARFELTQGFHADLLRALGYERSPVAVLLDDDRVVPVLYAEEQNQKPWLWIVEAPFASNADDADPFGESPFPMQLALSVTDPAPGEPQLMLATESWRELFDGPIFRAENPPRWVIFVAGSDVFLLDRDKWHQGKYLHFQLGRLLGLRDPKALQATVGLLHRDVLVPKGGQSLLEKLDEESHKHAFAVSTDLKLGAQKAIELLGNEAVRYRLEVLKVKTYDDELDVRELTRECITYLYRLLFLFYVEARGSELGVVPMSSDAYRLGYSLEGLRDLELVPLTTDEARNGAYLSDSLRHLFHLVQRGHGRAQTAFDFSQSNEDSEPETLHATFTLRGLRSPLFDEERTPILRAVKFKNQVLQDVLQLLSLSKEGKGKSRGRISYAQLGINQLGAVYEGLLSYTGFFASEELFEVRDEKEIDDESARTYFVPASKVDAYKKSELVKDEFNRPKKHAKGTFLFRLAGRDRERSASYYTPEVLTRCLTKYTLKVRLGEPLLPADDTPELRAQRVSADEILKLTLCEPAMGSGAFLNEAVSQLAEKYLEKKQQELGQTIPAEQYQAELAKVKYHFVVHNTYGVDLNPLAAELGKISLWLNVLHADAEAPYLDARIVVGNSLMGARREIFRAPALMHKGTQGSPNWHTLTPESVPINKERPTDGIYHFLVPHPGMAPYATDDKIHDLEPDNNQLLNEWRQSLTQPFTALEVSRLLILSTQIDALWAQHTTERQDLLQKLRQPVQVWGQPSEASHKRWKSVEECEEHARRLERPNAPGVLLKAVMDYWCALWFWPIAEAIHAPVRNDWISDIETLVNHHRASSWHADQGVAATNRIETVNRLSLAHRFHHWDLLFPEIVQQRHGFDVVIGNPPWIRIEWNESGILGDLSPELILRGASAKEVSDSRGTILAVTDARAQYVAEHSAQTGMASFVGSATLFPLLSGTKVNLYKAFLSVAGGLVAQKGIVGLFHQPGVFDDSNGARLRQYLTGRLSLLVRFQNWLPLFPEVRKTRVFCFTIFQGAPKPSPTFRMLANVFHPSTVDRCFDHDDVGPVPGIKDDDGHWQLAGHASRVVDVDGAALAAFAAIFDEPGTPASEARIPVIHSEQLLSTLRKLANVPSLARLEGHYFTSREWNETERKQDGAIREETKDCAGLEDLIFGSVHIYVATPFYKNPNPGCGSHRDYLAIDLEAIGSTFVPRTNYTPQTGSPGYTKKLPRWNGQPMTAFYRHVNRCMLDPTGGRTLVGAIIPPGPGSLASLTPLAFDNLLDLTVFAGLSASLPVDFLVKATGSTGARIDLLRRLPLPDASYSIGIGPLIARTLRLNCLHQSYEVLWRELFDQRWRSEQFAKRDDRLQDWSLLSDKWTSKTPFRTPFERRHALVEIDALTALLLGVSARELCEIYRQQFASLQKHEEGTFYDQRGRIVHTSDYAGLPGLGLSTEFWRKIQHAQAGDKLPAFAKDAGGPFVPPFDSCDRETDMAQAYRHFQARLTEDSVDELPTIIPSFSDDAADAKLFIWALLHASGGTATHLELAHAFVLRAHPALMKRLAPGSLKREVGHWLPRVGSRSVKAGMLAPNLNELADTGGLRRGTDSEGRATISTSSGTPTNEKLDPWFRFEADLVMKVLRAQPEEKRGVLDNSLSGADRKFLEGTG